MDASRRLVLAFAALASAPVAAAGDAREVASPRSYEAFFGYVKAAAPPHATHVQVFLGDRRILRAPVRAGRVSVKIPALPGRYDLRLRFEDGTRALRRDESRAVWLLPTVAQRAVREGGRDAVLGRTLRSLGRGFHGWAAFWVHDLATGRTAGWNSDASFPAASTVKLAVLVAALQRFGPRPERSPAWRDIRDLAGWSSNIATNRLLVRLGGSEYGGAHVAQDTLFRLGATSSTFTGFYRLGTSVSAPPPDAPKPLPFLPSRRTTAHDLGRILFELHAAAVGKRASLRRTGLNRHSARVALALLLASDPRGDNRGLLRPALGPDVPIAQKNGWTESVRHTAPTSRSRRRTAGRSPSVTRPRSCTDGAGRRSSSC